MEKPPEGPDVSEREPIKYTLEEDQAKGADDAVDFREYARKRSMRHHPAGKKIGRAALDHTPADNKDMNDPED